MLCLHKQAGARRDRWFMARGEEGGASALGIALAFTGVFHKRLCIGLEDESGWPGVSINYIEHIG